MFLKWREFPAILTGVMATLAGVGLARFAYTPLLPAIIQHEWFTSSQAVYLGAANLLGYLLGALSAHRLSERFSPRGVIAVSFAGIALSFILCAAPHGLAWFFLWRLVSGVAGATLMVVGPSLALSATPTERKKSVGALVFTGIGLGALLSATAVPFLLEHGLGTTWQVLGGIALVAGLVCDRSLARLPAPPPSATIPGSATTEAAGASTVVLLVVAAYALDAAGFIPHTVFWVDYLAREASLGAQAASLQWALFGVGAILGPLAASALVSRTGWHVGLSVGFLAKASAIAIPLLSVSLVSRSVSSLVVGAMVPGIVALTSGRLAELVGPAAHKRIWGQATAAFACAQAVSGYAMSGLYDAMGSYSPLFAAGSLLMTGGFVLVLAGRPVKPARI